MDCCRNADRRSRCNAAGCAHRHTDAARNPAYHTGLHCDRDPGSTSAANGYHCSHACFPDDPTHYQHSLSDSYTDS